MVYRTILDLSGNVIKAESFENESGETIGPIEAKTEIAALVSDASEAHALNSTFSDTEVEAALNALGAKLNAVIDALKA